MEMLSYTVPSPSVARGTRRHAIAGVVASGNLEVLAERNPTLDTGCTIDIATSAAGFGAVWEAVVTDFAARGAGGLHISINDGGARPDMVALRLAQVLRLIEAPEL